MIFLFIKILFSLVTTEPVQKNLYVQGDGIVTLEILRKNGDYKTFEKIIFEDGPTGIDRAFQDMSSLQTICFSKTIQFLKNWCFYQNYQLRKFEVSPDNPHLWTDGTYLYQNNNKTLAGSINSPTHFNILSSVESLASGCFSSVQHAQEIVLPKSIKTLERNIFTGSSINSIKFETDSVLEVIYEKSFFWGIISNIKIPPSVKEIQFQAFYKCSCTQLCFEDISRSNLTTISEEAFMCCGCKNLILPNGVTSIPNSCFSGSSLESIRIPLNCSSISETAFGGCTSLTSVTVDPSNDNFKEVEGSLYSKDGKQLVFAPPQLDSFVIPAELESISQSVVQNLVKVDKISIPDGNQHFSTFDGSLYDFDGTTLKGVCGGVKQLNVSATATSIAKEACKGVNIRSVRFLGGLCSSLGENAFDGCKLLTSFCVPRGLKYILTECFANSGLKHFTYEEGSSLESIEYRTFAQLSMTTIKLPKSLKYVKQEAFSGVSGIETFELQEGSSLKEIHLSSFRKMKCNKDNKITLPPSLSFLDKTAFSGCQLDISFAKDSIISSIPDDCFSYCDNIKGTLIIPSKIVSIQSSSFAYCTKIEKIDFDKDSKIENIVGSAFKGCANLTSLILPSSLESFDTAAVAGCFSLNSFTVDQANLNLSSNGNILYNKDKTELIVCSPGNENAYIDSSVQSIRSNGFFQCSKLINVIFNSPSHLVTISQNTFAECISLSTISLPVNLESLLGSAFSECSQLTKVTFDTGSKLVTIGPKVFYKCHSLKTVSFGGNMLHEISDSAFEDCYSLKEIEIPSSVKYLKSKCFMSTGIMKISLDEIM